MLLSELRTLYIRYEGTLPPLLREGSGADPTLVHDLLLNAIQRHQDAITLAEKEQSRYEVLGTKYEGESDELRVTSAKATSPAIRHSSFEIRNSESSALAWEGRIKINDPRLKDAPPHVRTARNEIKRLMPLISHLHLKLVEASKKSPSVQRNTLCKQLRARLEELIIRRTECWEILDTFAQEHASGAVTSHE